MPAEPGLIPSLMPVIFLFIPLAVVAFYIARRRGRSGWLWALIALVPYFNLLCLLYLASLPESSVIERIEALERRSANTTATANPTPTEPAARPNAFTI